ncbi:hypothetical protein AX17_000295 [Amanita inopinata Kibby_2008]|nr:hypothetical protein AX17_000295 [Amanita inopinata Kibby_2008]
MKSIDVASSQPSSRRPPVRVDTDGPWSVSVAETPHDARSYSLYIKTPTHNLTLTRTGTELIELDQKLRELHPDVKIPELPLDSHSFSSPPPKRKSTFLNTLSRLASPASGKSTKQVSASTRRNPTPQISPSSESSDPFTSLSPIDASTTPASPSATSTGIAAYLTAVSNQPTLRHERVWKRFVRVRTDDLESVRVERAIKRVRSDLAAHVGMSKEIDGADQMNGISAAPSEDGSAQEQERKAHANGASEEKNEATDARMEKPIEKAVKEANHGMNDVGAVEDANGINGISDTPVEKFTIDTDATAQTNGDDMAQTSVASDAPVARIHRSQSADPDKSSRLSRVYAASAPTQDTSSSKTGDESSISTTEKKRAKKKRSMSTAPREPKKPRRKVVIDDFEMMRVLGKGCAGKVLLVKHKPTTKLYALKAITKRHVLAHQELQHTLTEQAVLKRMAAEGRDPFVVKLWWSFHDKENLFLVMDFHPGGDLATQLARWGRLGRDRARFYAAEIVEGVEGLHAAGVIYRDLKPENILIGADGHIVLTDFGLSKEFPRRPASIMAPSTPSSIHGDFYSAQPVTAPWIQPEKGGDLAPSWHPQNESTTTFCGTAEYLAPEVIQGLPYSFEVDWWSFGTMLYEMLTGITPFWANNHPDMYVRVLQDELQFPDDRTMDQDTKSLIRGLLQRNPALRICEPRIKRHPYFSMIDWSHVYHKRYIPPYIPPIDPSNASDTQNFDDTFLDMEPVLDEYVEEGETDQEPASTDTDKTDGEESNATPLQSRSSSIKPQKEVVNEETVDVFDGYSFKGRHSVLIDEEEEEEEEGEEIGDDELESEISEMLENLEAVTAQVVERQEEPEVVEPKTPEARPAKPEPTLEDVPPLPPKESVVTAEEQKPADNLANNIAAAEPLAEKELPRPDESVQPPPDVPNKESKAKLDTTAQAAVPRAINNRATRARREKSGIPALDRYLTDGGDDETHETEREDDTDDDWDLIDAVDGEDRNGTKGTSYFARGVVDRYRLAVFRKASTPQRNGIRSVSGMSKNSEVTASYAADSPSPTQRRGRTPGLPFRKHHKQFLRPKSPPSSSKSSATAKSRDHSNANTISASMNSSSLLTPSLSLGSTLPVSPSLRSKESATSVGAQSQSSDQSGNADGVIAADAPDTIRAAIVTEEPEKHRSKKLRKYKENAEKVFLLFSSPRQGS